MQTENFIIYSVCKYLQTEQLTTEHKKQIIKWYRDMDQRLFKGYQLSKVGPVLGKVLGDKLLKLINRKQEPEEIDIRQYQITALGNSNMSEETAELIKPEETKQNKMLALDDFLGINDLTDFKLMFNPESLYKHYYLVLDSDFRDTSSEISSDIRRFQWAYAPTVNIGVGFCNSVGTIRNIIGMRMYQPRIPYLPAMNNTAKRVSVLIEEFSAQAFIAENGRRFHFLLRPIFVNAQTDIELSTEDFNDGIFSFRKPITEISTMTLSFGDPLDVLSFSTPFNKFTIAFEFVCLGE